MTQLQKTCASVFSGGVVIGALSGWLIAKLYYKRIAEEEIDKVVESYQTKTTVKGGKPKESTVHKTVINGGEPFNLDLNNLDLEATKDMGDYIQKAADYLADTVISYDHIESGKINADVVENDKPYQIESSEYGEFEDYECITFTYYLDGVIVDENMEPLDDPKELIGDIEDYEYEAGEFEDDCIYIRNDAKQCDYEVIYALEKYEDYLKKHPSDNILMMIEEEEE